MLGSPILDVTIGLILVFLLLSLICSAIREGIAGVTGVRAKMLERGIRELLQHDTELITAFYEHPQIWSLYRGDYQQARVSDFGIPFTKTRVPLRIFKNKLPSYIPSRNFALALLDMAARGRNARSALQSGPEANALTLDAVRRYVGNIGNPFVQRVLLSATDTAGNDLDRARQNIEAWFDSSMDRVSGWYKRRTQVVLFAIGAIVTVLLDVNAVRIANALYRDPALRDAAVAMAANVVREPRDSTAAASAASARQAYARLDSLGLPVPWPVQLAGIFPSAGEWRAILQHAGHSIFGWLLTAFAISFGAPFWFDTLNKIMVIRSTVKPHEKSPEEGSEDRQPKDRRAASKSSASGAPSVTIVTAPPAVPTPARGAGAPAVTVAAVAEPEFVAHEWTSGRPDGGIV